MEIYTETGKFKRDTINRNGKPTNQIRVTGLSVNSKFKDNEDLIIMSKTEFTRLENELINSNEKVKELESQINTASEILPANPKYYSELLEAKDEISTLKDIINNRNGLLMDTKDKVNLVLDKLLIELTNLYDTEIDKGNKETLEAVKDLIDLVQTSYNNIYNYLVELETSHNNNIDNSNLLTRLKKDNCKLKLDSSKVNEFTKDLEEINKYCNNYLDIVKPIEIPASKIHEIKLNATSKDLDINELFIDTNILDSKDNDIDITPDNEE